MYSKFYTNFTVPFVAAEMSKNLLKTLCPLRPHKKRKISDIFFKGYTRVLLNVQKSKSSEDWLCSKI